MTTGVFGGGMNSRIGDFSMRSDWDIELLWEWQNLGLGNAARIRATRTELEITQLEQSRLQDRVAADVVQARGQLRSAADRVRYAENEVRNAVESANKNFRGLGQTRESGKLLVLVIRPQEALASLQALAGAYDDYYGAIGDYNRAQFRLYRALGSPAERLCNQNVLNPLDGNSDTTLVLPALYPRP
jgi:hypothetical protein